MNAKLIITKIYNKKRGWTLGENKANIMVNSDLFIVHGKDNNRQFEKTKPILQFIVLCS